MRGRQFALQRRQLAFKATNLIEHRIDALGNFARLYLERSRYTTQRAFHPLHVGQGVVAGHRFDTAHSGCHAAFGSDAEQSDVARAPYMRTAAQFARRTDIDDAHLVAVFLAEEHHGAEFLRFGNRQHAALAIGIGQYFSVDDVFDAADFLIAHRLVVHEVKALSLIHI